MGEIDRWNSLRALSLGLSKKLNEFRVFGGSVFDARAGLAFSPSCCDRRHRNTAMAVAGLLKRSASCAKLLLVPVHSNNVISTYCRSYAK